MMTHSHLTGEGKLERNIQSTDNVLIVPRMTGLPWDDRSALVEQVAARNDTLARVAAGSAPRFGILPFPALEDSRAEVRRILDVLHLEGVCIVPIVAGKALDEPEFIPLIDDLELRGAQLLLHPVDTSEGPLRNPRYLDGMLAYARLLYSDRIRSMSRIKVILAHANGTTTFLAENVGMLYYLQAKRWRMGAFLADYIVKKRLRGVELVRTVECCA